MPYKAALIVDGIVWTTNNCDVHKNPLEAVILKYPEIPEIEIKILLRHELRWFYINFFLGLP